MGFEINWTANPGDPVLQHPFYQKYSELPIAGVDANDIKQDLGAVLLNLNSAGIVSYLSYLLRVKALLA
jgi:hypothetical protein